MVTKMRIPSNLPWKAKPLAWYSDHMATELTAANDTLKVDLTGLPEPVVQGIHRLVQTLRESLLPQESAPSRGERLPLRGRFVDQNLSIPKEDIDEAQREAWSGFPREFPEPGKP
jgi:hypothetical protein